MTENGNSDRLRCIAQPMVKRRERQAAPEVNFQIRCVVDGQLKPARKIEDSRFVRNTELSMTMGIDNGAPHESCS